MITIIEGKIGTTAPECAGLVLAHILHNDFKNGKKILTNMELNFEHKKFKLEETVEMQQKGELVNYSIGLDQAYYYYDARQSQSRENKLLSYLANKSTELSLVITTAGISNIDPRLRQAWSFILRCSPMRKGQVQVSLLSKGSGKSQRRTFTKEELSGLCQIVVPDSEPEDPDQYFLNELGFNAVDYADEPY